MTVVFKTNIDKFKNKFPTDFKIIPRIGEYVKVVDSTALPFDKLIVIDVTYITNDLVLIELHLSELQAKQNIQYNLEVFS